MSLHFLFMSLSGTQTEKNLAASFAGECMARTRYTYFSEVAKKQGYEQIAALLLETAENEREHAKIFFNLLKQNGGTVVEVPAAVPLTGIGSTAENLRAAMNGEHEETEVAYPHFAEIADKEGFKAIARTFRTIAKVEKEHELRYKILLEQVESGTVFKRTRSLRWKCRNCGFVFEGPAAPKACPACLYPQAYFEIKETLE
jgi:rubrerythrin